MRRLRGRRVGALADEAGGRIDAEEEGLKLLAENEADVALGVRVHRGAMRWYRAGRCSVHRSSDSFTWPSASITRSVVLASLPPR